METKQTTETEAQKRPTVKFTNCEKVGDDIEALVRLYTNQMLGEFVLSQALQEVKANNAKIEALKEELVSKKVRP